MLRLHRHVQLKLCVVPRFERVVQSDGAQNLSVVFGGGVEGQEYTFGDAAAESLIEREKLQAYL